MPTFKALVYADNRRVDGTYNVKIRLTHARQSLKVSTALYVDKTQLTRALAIKDQRVIDATDALIRRWRGYVAELGARVDTMDARQLLAYFKERDRYGDRFSLDFVEFCRANLNHWSNEGTRANAATCINSFERIIGHIDINDITPDVLRRYELGASKSAPKGTTVHYLNRLKYFFKLAQRLYNNPYAGDVKIPHSPFDYFSPLSMRIEPAKRAIPIDVVQRLIDYPYTAKYGRNLAKDMWLLSFGLCGVNAADILSWRREQFDGEFITYRRHKIAERAGERASMCVRVEPCIMPIVERYMANRGELLFDFRRDTREAASYHLPKIAQAIDYDGRLHQYSARHSWATIARNDCGVSLDVVNEALVHVPEAVKMTDLYIKRDFSRVWDANTRVLGLFNWEGVSR